MTEHQIQNWLIINWKDGTTRTRKSEPTASSHGTHELCTELTLDIVIPEVDVDELHATVEVPKPRVEQSELDDVTEDDAPDWMDVADEVVGDFIDSHGYYWGEWREYEDRYVIQALEGAPTQPPIEDLRTYLRQQVREVIRTHTDDE